MTELQQWANAKVQEHMINMRKRITTRKKPEVLARPISSSNPNVKYMVTKHFNGRIECNCPGFLYKRKCRHTKDLL